MLTWRSRVVDHARVLATLACVAAGSGTLFVVRAQTPPPQDPLPSFRTSIEAVQVAAIVTDERGEPVTGLTEADFEIFENGTMQPITTFSAVDIPVERSDPAHRRAVDQFQTRSDFSKNVPRKIRPGLDQRTNGVLRTTPAPSCIVTI